MTRRYAFNSIVTVLVTTVLTLAASANAGAVLTVVETAGDYYTITAHDATDPSDAFWEVKVDITAGGIFSFKDLTDAGNGAGGHTSYLDTDAYGRKATMVTFDGRGGNVLSRSSSVDDIADRLTFETAPDNSYFRITYTETAAATDFFHDVYGEELAPGELLTTIVFTINAPSETGTTWGWSIACENVSDHAISDKVWASEFVFLRLHNSVVKTGDYEISYTDDPWNAAAPTSYVRFTIGDNPTAGFTNGREFVLDIQSGQADKDAGAVVAEGSWAYFDHLRYTSAINYSTSVAPGDARTLGGQVLINIGSNPPPVADAGADQVLQDVDDSGSEEVTLDGTGSTTPADSIVSYEWSEGGSVFATGANPTVPMIVGVHTITLTITDSDGNTAIDEVTVEVEGVPMSFASAGDDQQVLDADNDGSEAVTLDGSNSAWTAVAWSWVLDGTEIATGVNPTVTLAVGVHTITCNVTDMQDRVDSDEVVIEVLDGTPKPPTADAGLDMTAQDILGGGSVDFTLDGTGSSDIDGTIVSYEWTLDGSAVGSGATPSVSLPIGEHEITLTVTDDDGLTDTDTVTITVVEYVIGENDAPYVGAAEADTRFADITAEEMDIIRSKKVLLASRSFGFNLENGLNYLAGANPMYDLDYLGRFDVRTGGVDALPVDVFDQGHFVQYLSEYWPHDARLVNFQWFIDTRYHDQIDAAIVFYHTARSSIFDTYATVMDSLRIRYPDIKFIYVGSGFSPVAGDANNIESTIFRNMVLERYRGKAPIYDLGDILSTHEDGTKATFTQDGEVYRMMCPEFNINGDNTHPNAQFPQERMGRGMLVMLKELFIETETKLPGDANLDGTVDLNDFVLLKTHFGSGTTWGEGDFNGDGDVDLEDFVILKTNFGASN